jgi:hypothetical protein
MIPEEGIKPIEATCRRIIISGTQILLPDLCIKLFAAVQEFRQSGLGIETQRLTIGVERIQLNGGTDKLHKNPCASVTVKREIILLLITLIIRYNLCNARTSDNVGYGLSAVCVNNLIVKDHNLKSTIFQAVFKGKIFIFLDRTSLKSVLGNLFFAF